MRSGREVGDVNVETFRAWVAGKTDEDYRAMTMRGVLSRKEIATECQFAKSVLHQNPRIKQALYELEEALRARGVLPPPTAKGPHEAHALPLRDNDSSRRLLEAERLKRLEQENASQKAEIAELKRQLERYAVLHEALASTGRLPR
jgi:hypothetical protein